ncbi:cell division protein FtsQ/DivIB [Natranaerofaba carboxydovora]|uniref:cell division protein FtsQ/DivIB n=1 Tax=Natranaerofaba carboxydovora TaxID=2742683 RepID=UPI001F12D3B6|nr:FtsQ-type POTRA domain-containing protein [Natranaerofaba carboxydovora]UMZ73261.1 Cell division protein DivIB [Natranaerofaba carboxydovora]
MDKQVVKLKNKRSKKIGESNKNHKFKIKKIRIWVLLLLCLGLFTLVFMSNSRYFEIKNVKISGNEKVSSERLINDMELKGENILFFGEKTTEERILENKWIKKVEINTILPNKVEVDIAERTPIAVYEIEDSDKLVLSSDLVILDEYASREGLPIINGINLDAVVESYEPGDSLKKLTSKDEEIEVLSNVLDKLTSSTSVFISEIVIVSDSEINLFTEKGLKVKMGKPEELETKYALIEKIIPEVEEKKGQQNFRHLDLRVPKYPVLKELDENNSRKEEEN